MNRISLYAAKHTDAAHISEFFNKKLIADGEEPLAFFDGVFYEAKNERVGGIAFHDYLIFSSKSVYIWARGIHKDYLDRFPLGSISISAKTKDNEFCVLDLTITRDGKPPIVLIFDLIPKEETQILTRLHLELEVLLESFYGKRWYSEISDEAALKLIESAKALLPQRTIPVFSEGETDDAGAPFLPFTNPLAGMTKVYGDSLLQRLRAQRGQSPHVSPFGEATEGPPNGFQPRNPFQQAYSNASLGLGNLDMVSLKRAEAITRDLINNIPEEYREQAKADLEKLPDRITETLSTLNELVKNISGNPQAQNFIIQTVATAVKNDGILGAVVKAFATYQAMPNPPGQPPASGESDLDTEENDASGDDPTEVPTPNHALAQDNTYPITADENIGGAAKRKRIKISVE